MHEHVQVRNRGEVMKTIVACLILLYEFDRIMAHINRQTRRKRWPR